MIFLFCFITPAVLAFGRPALARPLSVDLDTALESALGSDKSIKAAEADAAKANEGRRQAHRSRSVTMKIEHNTARVNQYKSGIDVNSFHNAVSAEYPLYTGGRIEGSIAASEYEWRSKLLSLERARQNVKLAAAVAFFTMLNAGDAAEHAGKSVERLDAHVRYVDAQYRNGKVGKADLLRSQVDLINAEQTMAKAENDYGTAVKSLNSIMGLPLETELVYEGKMTHAEFNRTLDDCVEYALSGHPDLGIAELAEKKAEAGILIEKSAGKPQVTLAVSQSFSSLNNWPGPERDELQIALHAEYTFSDGGVTASKIRGAKEDLKKAGYNREAVRDAVVLEVTKYFMAMEESRARIETAAAAAALAQEAYRIASVRYREGVGTNIDVLDAQEALHQSGSAYTQALCDYNIAAARIDHAAGVPVLSASE